MDDPAKPGPAATIAAEIAAALDWWRGAGVDTVYEETPTRWLAEESAAMQASPQLARAGADQPSPAGARPRRDARAPVQGETPAPADRASWPNDLAAFNAWWLDEPSLDNGRRSGRVAPRGEVGAELMILVAEPEREDGEQLLSGPEGRLLDAMLRAMSIDPATSYVASVLPRHTPMVDWNEVERGLAGVVRHHVGLVKPARLLVFGSNILPLLGNDPAHSPAVSRTFNHEGLTMPLLAGKSLAALIERPRWKAGLWQGWLDWTGGA